MSQTTHATKAGKDFCNAMLATITSPEHSIDGFVQTNLALLRAVVTAQRYAIHLTTLGGLTVEEIAKTLDISTDIVEGILKQSPVAQIEVGHIVRPTDGDQLRSGCEAYGAAVCISVEPFILVSEHADMRWSTKTADKFEIVGKASAEMLALCMTRLA